MHKKAIPTLDEWKQISNCANVVRKLLTRYAEKQGQVLQQYFYGQTGIDGPVTDERIYQFITEPLKDTNFVLWYFIEGARDVFDDLLAFRATPGD